MLIKCNHCILYLEIDECDLNIHNCHIHATCVDMPTSFACNCNQGYTGNGIDCQGKHLLPVQRNNWMGVFKKLNKVEIALNVAKRLKVCKKRVYA